tara:strand:- start:289 stop:405 length:117 start_codon:yes stop_codon:yes gene_type:complete
MTLLLKPVDGTFYLIEPTLPKIGIYKNIIYGNKLLIIF